MFWRPMGALVLLTIAPVAGAQGTAAETEDLSGLSLEELLATPVAIASKTPTATVIDAPGWLTVYSHDDIRRLGYDTLADLANITPGYSTYPIFGERVFETRGQKAASFDNNKHVLFVDGIPISHARALKIPIDEELPLDFAGQVEFLRGPASALYGVNAFYGAINVLPRQLDKDGSLVETFVRYGPRHESVRVATSVMQRTDRSVSGVDVGLFRRSATLAFVGTVDDPDNRYRDDQNAVFVRIAHDRTEGPLEGIGAGAFLLARNGGLGEGFLDGDYTNLFNDITWITFVPYVRYRKALGTELQLNSFAKYNLSVERGSFAPFSAEGADGFDGTGTSFAMYESRVSNYEVLTELRWDPSKRRSFIAGIDLDYRIEHGENGDVSADPGPPISISPFDVTDVGVYSLFAQYEERLPFLEGLTLVLGGHADLGISDEDSYTRFSPRAAVVQRITPNFELKLQYGTALRAPGIKEIGINRQVEASASRPDVPELLPESFQAVEAGVAFHNSFLYASVAGFYDVTTDAIERQPQQPFRNIGGTIRAYGTTVDVRSKLGRTVELRLNHSWARAEDPQDVELFDVPSHKANLVLMHRLADPVRLSSALVVRWVKDYRAGDRPAFDGNTVVDLSFLAPVGESLDLGLQVRNLFGLDYKLPRNGLAQIPMPGTDVMGSLTGRF